jgi:hypothetical protein
MADRHCPSKSYFYVRAFLRTVCSVPATHAPFSLSVTSTFAITLRLPHGPLTIKSIDRVHAFLDQLPEHVTTFGEVNSQLDEAFWGYFSGWGGGVSGRAKGEREWEWNGDEVKMYSDTGKVKNQYVDEVRGCTKSNVT